MGRHSEYTPEMAERICELLSEGNSLRQIERMDGMPAIKTILRWVRANPEFRTQYSLARDDLLEHWAEDIIDVADGTEESDQKRVRIDARKWILCKLLPKRFGEKLAVGGAEDLPPLKITTTDAKG